MKKKKFFLKMTAAVILGLGLFSCNHDHKLEGEILGEYITLSYRGGFDGNVWRNCDAEYDYIFLGLDSSATEFVHIGFDNQYDFKPRANVVVFPTEKKLAEIIKNLPRDYRWDDRWQPVMWKGNPHIRLESNTSEVYALISRYGEIQIIRDRFKSHDARVDIQTPRLAKVWMRGSEYHYYIRLE